MAVLTARPVLARPQGLVWLLLVTVLALAVAGGLLVGSRLLNATAPMAEGRAAVLAFDSLDGDIHTIRADGTDRRQLTSGSEVDKAPVWSPDGTRIAFRRIAADGTAVAVMDADGGELRIIYTGPPAETSEGCVPHAPAWSPDGEWLAFTHRQCPSPGSLYIARADGSGTAGRILAPGSGLESSFAPSWARSSIGGTAIAFIGEHFDGGSGVYVVDLPDGASLGRASYPARLITGIDPGLGWLLGDDAPLSAPSWSPDGSTVAAAGGTNSSCGLASSGTMDAFAIAADGSGTDVLAADPAKEYNPIWSLDGRQLAFQRIVEPSEYINGRPCTMAVWIADADGANARRIEGLGTDHTQPPLWSPDSTRIVGNTVDVIDGEEHYDMYIATVDGSSPLVTVHDVGYATWRPDAGPLGSTPSISRAPAP